MKRASSKKKAFTIVELIIVIAVIGILAAILIPTFSNMIAKANAKSALADARSTLTNYLAEDMSNVDGNIAASIVIFVSKAKSYYVFGYNTRGENMGKLMQSAGNPYMYEDLAELISDYNCPIDKRGTEEEENYPFFLWPHDQPSGTKSNGGMEEINSQFINLTDRVTDLPESVQVFDGYLIGHFIDAEIPPSGGGTEPSDEPGDPGTTEEPGDPGATEDPGEQNDQSMAIIQITDTFNGSGTEEVEINFEGNSLELTYYNFSDYIPNYLPNNNGVDFEFSMNITANGTYTMNGCPVVDDYIGVKTAVGFNNIVNDTDRSYQLQNNITVNTPLGSDSVEFTGTFDGNNKEITFIHNDSTKSYVGVFGHIGNDGTVKNLNVSFGTISGGKYCGAVAGYNAGTITNCTATGTEVVGTASGGSIQLGGFVGYNSGTVSHSTCNTNVTNIGAGSAIGGFVGENYNGTMLNCHFEGNVTATDVGTSSQSGTTVGGFAGRTRGPVSYCSAKGTTLIGYATIGGFAGNIAASNAVEYCFAEYINVEATVTDAYASFNGYAGGFASIIGGTSGTSRAVIQNCYARVTGKLKAVNKVYGFGYSGSNATVIACYSFINEIDCTGPTKSDDMHNSTISMTVSDCYSNVAGAGSSRDGFTQVTDDEGLKTMTQADSAWSSDVWDWSGSYTKLKPYNS